MIESIRRAVRLLPLVLLFAGSAPAATIEGVDFADRVRAGDRELALHATGLLRYRYVIKAYVAALYLAPGAPPASVLDDQPKRLELEYFWNLSGRDIAEAGADLVRRAVDDTTWQQLESRISDISALYEDIQPGDRYSLTYLPGRGTELAKNGRPLGTIPGADFARAYFGIWLGPEPLDEGLRDTLLAP